MFETQNPESAQPKRVRRPTLIAGGLSALLLTATLLAAALPAAAAPDPPPTYAAPTPTPTTLIFGLPNHR